MTIERLCGWHGIAYHGKASDGKRYVSLGYWLVIIG